MLVLSRMPDEEIIIGGGPAACGKDAVVVAVVSIEGDKVRLGITAPADVEVHRREVFERKFGTAAPAARRRVESRVSRVKSRKQNRAAG